MFSDARLALTKVQILAYVCERGGCKSMINIRKCHGGLIVMLTNLIKAAPSTCLIVSALLFPISAKAHLYEIDYISSSSLNVDLVVTTSDSLTNTSFGSGFLITSVTGMRGGVPVNLLSNAFSADNILYPAVPYFDYAGFAFTTAGNDTFNIYWGNVDQSRILPGSYFECYAAGCDGLGYKANPVSELSVSGIPEPATWEMMLLSFVGIGLVGYRQSKKTDTPQAYVNAWRA